MVLPRVEEKTLYPPIIQLLQRSGFEAVGNTIVMGKEPDIVFRYGSLDFVIEVKIGRKESVGLNAVAQAYDYGRRLKTQNVIIVIYPEEIRNTIITDFASVGRIATESELWAVILTEYWTESREVTLDYLARQLKLVIDKKLSRIDFASAVKMIGKYASDLNAVVYQIRTDELVAEVVDKLDLFASVGEIREKEAARNQIVNLASFLLFNQLLFYHIYTRKVKDSRLPEMNEISSLEDIQAYFNSITSIDYRSIYRTNLLAHIPESQRVVDVVNEVIKAIKLLRAEYISHDLAGRFFHDLIPFEVRKILAAFYTHPNSADLLTGLAIDQWDSTIIDPACGSGTLLVSSYKAKTRLLVDRFGNKGLKEAHKRFLERDLTGVDIMPFAAHMTTINLATQNIEQPTNLVRVASMDSLNVAGDLRKSFRSGNGMRVSGFERTIQGQLDGGGTVIRKHGAVSADGRGAEFLLTPVDLVIMNPPFSDREKMPKEMRDKINGNSVLNRISGNRANLWGSFLALSDLLVKDGGKVAAVIPINFARGESTRKIRDYYLRNYSIQYIIKPLEDDAFSEGASFKDILFIARKSKPHPGDATVVVTIKTSLKSLPPEAIRGMIAKLRSSYGERKEINTDTMEVQLLDASDLSRYRNNMMPLIGFSSSKNKRIFDRFLSTVRRRGSGILRTIVPEEVSEGFHASPAGLSELVFITRPIIPARVERAFLILDGEKLDEIAARVKGLAETLSIERVKVKPALRTLTGVKTFETTNTDYILVDAPSGFDRVLQLSKWSGSFEWAVQRENVRKKTCHVVVGRRFRPNSKNTHHFAFYSKEGFVSPDTFKMLRFESDKESRLQTLFLNSSISMVNILSLREQTTGGFTDIRESELTSFDLFNIKSLGEESTSRLLTLFDSLARKDSPSIVDQYVSTAENMLDLDVAILKALGFDEEEAREILFPVYEAIIDELRVKG